MSREQPIQVRMPYFPFTDGEYQAYRAEPNMDPQLFGEIRRAARDDIERLLDSMLPHLLSRAANLGFDEEHDDPVSHNAFLTRIGDVLKIYTDAESSMKGDGSPIPTDFFDFYLLRASKIVTYACFQNKFGLDELRQLNGCQILLKGFAATLMLHGQVADSQNLLRRIDSLAYLEKSISGGELRDLPKPAWTGIYQIEIVFGILAHLNNGIVPSRMHLQEERRLNKKNFSKWFSPLLVSKLIPSGKIKPNEFFKSIPASVKPKSCETLPMQAYYSIRKDTPSRLPPGKWPNRMFRKKDGVTRNQKGVTHERRQFKGLREKLIYDSNFNYFHVRSHRPWKSDIDHLSHGEATKDAASMIKQIEEQLGGLYWHFLACMGMQELKTDEDLADFVRDLQGFGLSLDL